MGYGQFQTVQDGSYSTSSTWFGGVPDESVSAVQINHNVVLDQNLDIQADFDVNLGLNTSNTFDIDISGVGSFDVDGSSSTGGDLDLTNSAQLFVRSNDTLVVNNATMRQTSTILIETGGVLIVQGDLLIRNSVSFELNGKVIAYGDAEIEQTATIYGNGSFETYGETDINNSGVIFGSTEPCTSGCFYSNGCALSLTTSIWTGNGSINWNDGSSWSNGVPDSNTVAIIPGTAGKMPVVWGIGYVCFSVEVQSGATLSLLGSSELDVYQNITINGTLNANTSRISVIGTCATGVYRSSGAVQFYNLAVNKPNNFNILGGGILVRNKLELGGGVFNTGDSLIFMSDANGTAYIDEITGGASLTGNIEARRYIDAGATNWRFFTLPISGGNLEQFDDDFITSGFPGTDYPNWPSMLNPWPSFYFYNESLGATFDDGFYPPSSTGDVVAPGQGVWIWCGDTITGTQPFVIDAFGPANQGTISLPVSFNIGTGLPTDDGWNMVANPYQCTVDWDDLNWSKLNVDNAIYIWNPDLQQYASYVFGIGVNGGSNLIAPWQSFMVRANAPGPSLVVNERCKYDGDAPFLRANQLSSDLLRLTLSDGIGGDETVIRFDDLVTNDFDEGADAYKMEYQYTSSPSMYSVFGGDNYSINSLHKQDIPESVALHFKAVYSGTHSIQVSDKSAIEDFACVILEDLHTGLKYNLMTDSLIQFNATPQDAIDRFLIHFIPSYKPNGIEVSCSGQTDGAILINSGLIGWNYIIIGANYPPNQGIVFDDTLTTGLSSGQYTVNISDPSGTCPSASKTVYVSEPPLLSSLPTATPVTNGNCNGEISFNVEGGSQPYSIQINGLNANQTEYYMCEGAHTYTVTDANGCTNQGIVVIENITSTLDKEQTQIEIFPNPANDIVLIKSEEKISVRMYNSIGELVKSLTGNRIYQLDVSNLAAGVYVIECTHDDSVQRRPLVVK